MHPRRDPEHPDQFLVDRASSRARWWTPALSVFLIALVFSTLLHIETFHALSWISPPSAGPAAPPSAGEIEFDVAFSDEESAPTSPETALRARRVVSDPQQAQRPPPPERAPETPPPATPAVPAEPAPQPNAANLQAVTQHSDDPSVPPPENPQFLAEQNRRVEEETVAEVRSMVRDDAVPVATSEQTPEASAPEGDAEQAAPADDHGDTQRGEPPPRRASQEQSPAPSEEGSDRTERGGASEPRRASASHEGGGAEQPATERRGVMVRDPSGSFELATVTVPRGRGVGSTGGTRRSASRAQENETDTTSGERQGRGGRPDLRVSWSNFEATYGEDTLSRERTEYASALRTKTRGSGARQRHWREFRAAIENYIPSVRSGNQTALNAAASPFAAYLAEVHRRIHVEFADRFLASMSDTEGPFADPSLVTELEVVFNRDGSVHRIGVTRTSGNLPYDYGAFEAVMRGQPYPEPPAAILSGDDRVYVHWGFYRNERQCGTFNASPFILPHPPGGEPSPNPWRDVPARRPRGSTPANPGALHEPVSLELSGRSRFFMSVNPDRRRG